MHINGRCQNVTKRVRRGGLDVYTLTDRERERENEGWVAVSGTTRFKKGRGSKKMYLPEDSKAVPARPSGRCRLVAW